MLAVLLFCLILQKRLETDNPNRSNFFPAPRFGHLLGLVPSEGAKHPAVGKLSTHRRLESRDAQKLIVLLPMNNRIPSDKSGFSPSENPAVSPPNPTAEVPFALVSHRLALPSLPLVPSASFLGGK